MAEQVTLTAMPRNQIGTRASRQLRKQGRMPAVVYGHQEEVEAVSLDRHEVEVALAHGARTLEVAVGNKKQTCLIKEVQYDHFDTTPIHLDLTRVDINERVQVMVGIELRGTAKGVSHGGVLDMHLVEIEVECLVTEIPETLRPMVTALEVGDSLAVKDLELPAGVVAVTGPDERICTIHALKIAEDEAPEAEAEAEAETDSAEPERIGRVRKEDEGAGGGKRPVV